MSCGQTGSARVEGSKWTAGGAWRHSAEVFSEVQGPHLSGFPLDTPGIVVPAVPSRLMVEVALGGQREWQTMVTLTWDYTSCLQHMDPW